MDILGPLPKKKQLNQFAVVMTDLYTKFNNALSATNTNATTVDFIFLEHWVVNCCILSQLLTENGPQLVSKFFAAVCSTLGVNKITTTKYRPQNNGQAELFNSTFISRLRHYVSEYQTDWDPYLLPLTYAYDVQVYRSIKVSLFCLALMRTPPGPATVVPKRPNIATDDDMVFPLYARL